MRNYYYLFIVGLCFLLIPSFLLGQPPCSNNPNSPFGVSSSNTICANSDGVTSVSFTIFNEGTPGDYEITFPDGMDTTILGVSSSVSVIHNFNFLCDDMPGDPISPNGTNHFFTYNNELIITRLDCVDNLGQTSTAPYNFNVVPNPVGEFTYSNTDCIGAPFQVTFTSDICDKDLVQSYQWYINGAAIPPPLGIMDDLEDYPFPGPGTYNVRLEVIDYFSCGPFSYEEPITITAAPSIFVSLNIDSSTLCQPTITIPTINNSLFVDNYFWSSSSNNVSFSNPTSATPTITINNTMAGSYSFTLEASNAECGSETQTFEVTTFNEQMINISVPLVSCTQAEITLCDFIDYMPTPSTISWTASSPDITLVDANTVCPIVTGGNAGSFTLNAMGTDICGSPFSETVPITITPSENLIFNLSAIDTLCETSASINLLNFVAPADNIIACSGTGVNGCEFTPSLGSIGVNVITFIDSCGISEMIEILVTEEGGFQGGNPTLCIGESLNLNQIQSGTYMGNGVSGGIFSSSQAGIGNHIIQFSSNAFCGGSGQFQISVINFPIAEFSIQNISCGTNNLVFPINEILSITNLSTANVSCYSILETGENICGSNSAEFTFPVTGQYTIQQIVETNSGNCKDTIEQSIFIEGEYAPIVMSQVDSTACDSVTFHFMVDDVITDYTYQWEFSNGTQMTTASPTITIARPFISESFTASLEIITFCDTIFFETEVVLPSRFQMSFDILNDNDETCSESTAYFQNTSSNFDSLSITYGEGMPLPLFADSMVFFNNSDSILKIEIILEGFRDGCPPQTSIDTLVVFPVDTEAEFSLTYNSPACAPFTITLEDSSTPGSINIVDWGDGSTPQQIESLTELQHSYNFSQDTLVIITLISELCGKDTIQKPLQVYAAPSIDFDYVALGEQCLNDSILFLPIGDVDSNFDVDWNFNDGLFSNLLSPTHTFINGGIYDVLLTVTDTNGCVTTASNILEIFDYSGIPLEVEAPNVVCEDVPIDITINGEENIWIDYGNGLQSSELLPAPYQNIGDFFLTISSIDDEGCSQDTILFLSVVSSIDVIMMPQDTAIEFGDVIELSYTTNPIRNIQSIQWAGDSVYFRTSQTTPALPTNSGYYSISLIDEFGCPTSDSSFVSIIKEYDGRFYVPNAFSPNDDGFNDIFYIYSKPNTIETIESLQIFNRWGEIVFGNGEHQPDDPSKGWDGKLNGRFMKPSVFVWKAKVRFLDGEARIYYGDVTLLK